MIFSSASWDSGSAWAYPRCLQGAPPSKTSHPLSPPSSSRTTTGTSQTPHLWRSPSILSAPPLPHRSASLWAPRTKPSVTRSSDGCWAFCEVFRRWLVNLNSSPAVSCSTLRKQTCRHFYPAQSSGGRNRSWTELDLILQWKEASQHLRPATLSRHLQ